MADEEKLILIPKPEPRYLTYWKSIPGSLKFYTFIMICALFFASFLTTMDYNVKYMPSSDLLAHNNTLSPSPTWFATGQVPQGYTDIEKYETCSVGYYNNGAKVPKGSFSFGWAFFFAVFALVMTHLIAKKTKEPGHFDLEDSKRMAEEMWKNAELKYPGEYGELKLTEPILQMREKEKIIGTTVIKTNLIFGEVKKKGYPPFWVCFEFHESTGKLKGTSYMKTKPNRYDFCGNCGAWADERISNSEDIKRAVEINNMFKNRGGDK